MKASTVLAEATAWERRGFAVLLGRLAPRLAFQDADTLRHIAGALVLLTDTPPENRRHADHLIASAGIDPTEFRDWLESS